MEQKQALLAVKGAMALHSPLVGIGDIANDTSLEIVGITKPQIKGFTQDLHRLLTSGLEVPVAYTTFSARMQVTGESTAVEIADQVLPLMVPMPTCSTDVPVPDVASCRLWMTRSYFCRVRRAVTNWAKEDAIPPGGISPDLTLDSLVDSFDQTELERLVRESNNQKVFQPYDVKAERFPGVTGATTVRGYAKILWDNNRTPCSIIVKFPKGAK